MARPLSPQLERATLVDVLRHQAAALADQIAFSFLREGEVEEESLTFATLDQAARALAGQLQARGAAGQRVVLLQPPGLGYVKAFFACLYAGAVAVPAYPPRANQNLRRIQAIMADCQAGFVISTGSVLERLAAGGAEGLGREHILIDSSAPATREHEWQPRPVGADDIAFLQYTSGSTGSPKGAVLTHGNLLANLAGIGRWLGCREEDAVAVSWLPLYHDMGLIGGVLLPVALGFRVVLMPPAAFLQKPLRWLQAISDHRAFLSGAPDFAYEHCVRRIGPGQAEALSLASWRLALNGAEPVRLRTLERFGGHFAAAGFRAEAFRPCYGLAEATLWVSGTVGPSGFAAGQFSEAALQQGRGVPQPGTGRWLVGCGDAGRGGSRIEIVDPATRARCEAGQVGEIWVSGPSVAQGYWGNQGLTGEVFRARTADGAGPFLRTGDLGFLCGGELFVTGRLKDLIIVRGRNHYPQDIEATVEAAAAGLQLGACAAFPVDAPDGEALVIVFEAAGRPPVTADHLRRIAHEVQQAHELGVAELLCVLPGEVPCTSSGKIQRHACRDRYLRQAFGVRLAWRAPAVDAAPPAEAGANGAEPPPAQRVQAWLVSQVARRSGLHEGAIDVNEPLSAYVLDSLSAVELSHGLEAQLGVCVPLEAILAGRSIAVLARTAGAGTTIPAGPRRAQSELSLGQQRLWFSWKLDPAGCTYNVFEAWRIRGPLDVPLLCRCVERLLERHEVLRATFIDTPEGPRQVVQDRTAIDHGFDDLAPAAGTAAAEPQAALQARLATGVQRPFDLATGPLVRMQVVRLDAQQHVVAITLHHIVADGWSAQILVRELGLLYAAQSAGVEPALEPLRLQYADFARWQNSRPASALRDLANHWQARLAGCEMVLDLPLDRPRPPVLRGEGARCSVLIDRVRVEQLRAFGQAQGATLFMVFLGAIQALLHRYTRQRTILLGVPVSGRHAGGLDGMVGFLVNTLVMRADFDAQTTFESLTRAVRATVLDAFAHQDLPFHKLVEVLKLPRDLSRSPVFQASFTYHNLHNEKLGLGGLEVEPFDVAADTTNFDLGFSMVDEPAGTRCTIRYKTDLFEPPTIGRMLGHLQRLLDLAVDAPATPLAALPLLTAAQTQALAAWNATDAQLPGAGTGLHALFEAQAAATPATIALVCGDVSLSYAELDRRANRLAHELRARGVSAESRVGVAMDRSLEMVVGLLAVLKAGAAYVPVDAGYPVARIRYMLEDAAVQVLLTQQQHAAALAGLAPVCLEVDRQWDAIARRPGTPPGVPVQPGQLAYVIYTSGSTGRPKGAMNTHAAVRNRILWMQQAYRLRADDCVLQKTPFSFDVSVWEFFWPLATGARLVMARPGGHIDPEYLARVCAAQRVTTLHFVPSMLEVFLQLPDLSGCAGLRQVFCSGEALPPPLVRRFAERCGAQLHNLYGPTEAAVDVTAWPCPRGGDLARVPIGRPIANLRMHVLDGAMNPLPVGVPGELYIGGLGLARGYWGRPGLTAERFVPSPFGSGERLYRTGDLGRWLAGGDLDYLGRIDQQVKLRGFRIELGEIEHALAAHPAVRAAAAFVVRAEAGDSRLAAAVVPDWSRWQEPAARVEDEQVAQWQSLYEEKYGQAAPQAGGRFNIASWDSSYTGAPIPAAEMQEWVDGAVGRILALGGRRVLEIGCGTGLMLFRVAPHTEAYWATDFSAQALAHVAAHLDVPLRARTHLLQRPATDFAGIAPGQFDRVVLNSVVQYFPDAAYLTQVLAGAVRACAPGGKVFVGDARQLRLLELFHASVQLHQASGGLTVEQVRQRIARQAQLDKELVVDPRYFHALRRELPRITRIQVLPKAGRHRNEMSKYRYDVVLHLDEPAGTVPARWIDWDPQVPAAQQLAVGRGGTPVPLGARGIPNAMLAVDRAARAALDAADGTQDAAGVVPMSLRQALAGSAAEAGEDACSLEAITQAAGRLGLQCEFSWASCDRDGRLDAVFWPAGTDFLPVFDAVTPDGTDAFGALTNHPVQARLGQQLGLELAQFLRQSLPEHMVPATFHVLECLPLSANGKLDRRALESLGREVRGRKDFVAPRNFIEEQVAALWAEVMGLERVGVDENFFELGGHSLLLTQIATRLRTGLHVEIPLMELFDAPTVAAMAAAVATHLEQEHAAELDGLLAELESLDPDARQRLLHESEALE